MDIIQLFIVLANHIITQGSIILRTSELQMYIFNQYTHSTIPHVCEPGKWVFMRMWSKGSNGEFNYGTSDKNVYFSNNQELINFSFKRFKGIKKEKINNWSCNNRETWNVVSEYTILYALPLLILLVCPSLRAIVLQYSYRLSEFSSP